MTNIKINDLKPQDIVVELDFEKIEDIKGGCPVCIPLLIAAGIAAGWSLN